MDWFGLIYVAMIGSMNWYFLIFIFEHIRFQIYRWLSPSLILSFNECALILVFKIKMIHCAWNVIVKKTVRNQFLANEYIFNVWVYLYEYVIIPLLDCTDVKHSPSVSHVDSGQLSQWHFSRPVNIGIDKWKTTSDFFQQLYIIHGCVWLILSKIF